MGTKVIDKFELEFDFQQGLEIKECMHEPDKLDFIDWECTGDRIVQFFRCDCGKTVKEIYNHFDTRVIE